MDSILLDQNTVFTKTERVRINFSILKFIRPSSNSIFNYHSPKGIKLITRLSLALSHLRRHKFRHNFQDTPISSCGDDVETTVHYLLHCRNYLDEKRTLLDNLQSIGGNIHDQNDSQFSEPASI